MPKQHLVIAIDGPAGSGKSTVARKVAARLALCYVDSGASYRAVALKVLRAGLATQEEDAIVRLVERLQIQFSPTAGEGPVIVDGEDVSGEIRTPEVTEVAARISRLPGVRKRLVALQRGSVSSGGVVMEGRDIGTKVFPDADLKVFLVASEGARARRRLQDNLDKGRKTDLKQTHLEINRRDRLDSERKISPLVTAADAVKIDSTGLSVDQVVEKIVSLVNERCAAKLGNGSSSPSHR